MAIKTFVLILAIVAGSGRAQLTRFLFSGFTDNTRSLGDTPSSYSPIRQILTTSGNLFADVVDSLTAIPIAAARSLQQGIPRLINNNNIESSNRVSDASSSTDEDAKLSVGELITKYGYPMEKHRAITDDGYVLSMFRIPSNGSVVFLMHGLLGSADDYILAGPESGLAYLLSNEGYDVWMGNARGNKHSRRHIQYQPADAAFWDFTWNEIGCHDLPAMIDYVLNTTGQPNLTYIGHSQGTTSFFVMASEKPEYNEKISLMVALSPVAFMSHARSPIVRLLAPTGPLIHGFFKTLGVHEFLPDNPMMRTVKQMLCGAGHLAEVLCSNALFLVCGIGFDQLNETNLPVIYGHVPSGAASNQLVHYGQGIISGEFRKFDYGVYENQRKYGSSQPPEYELSKIVTPVALFYSDADWLSHPSDVDKLYNKLNSAVDIYKVPLKEFNHLDFIWAKDFKKVIFNRIKKLMKYF